ncbi:MAG: hydrogenase nickel incorporation protein HypB [Nocardioidaceae bacterium]|nr:hydrogenase nickel incorporation protein HypB [Nocardioidaceae bacterium]
MCSTCGCDDEAGVRVTSLQAAPSAESPHPHTHEHPHEHPHQGPHEHLAQGRHEHAQQDRDERPQRSETLVIEREILAKNDLLAAHNRGWLAGRGITALNVMSSPGSGKTTLLARTITEMAQVARPRPVAVIEGDQETLLDAERIRRTGAPVVQINTGAGCHLDAEMLRQGLERLSPPMGALLFVENVGNLVCPALFDLGETARVVVISVTEGEDKPLKYPHMFAGADLVVVNKSDLLPYVDFDVDGCMEYARRVNPGLPCVVVSAKTGDNIGEWYKWLEAQEKQGC